MNTRSVALTLALLSGIAFCQIAAAQTQAATGARSEDSIEEITVTARRVSENIQNAPVSVSAFSESQLQDLAVSDATDLNGRAPNVLIAETGAGTSAQEIFIRGIGLNALAFNLENPVGVYVDDVYLGRLQGALVDNLDFERIEILRGPQGTLYGRNSTVGALKYVTKEPDLTDAHYLGEVTLGDYARADTRLSVSNPIIPGTLAAQFDFGSRSQDGYIIGVNPAGTPTGELGDAIRRQTARLAVLWLPADHWRVNVTADYTVDRSGTTVGTPLVSVNGGPCNSAVAPCKTLFNSDYEAGLNDTGIGHDLVSGLSGRVQYEAQSWTFKSITSVRTLLGLDAIDVTSIPDNSGGLLPDHKTQNQESQEFQLASNSTGKFSWITGLFYYREYIHHTANFLNIQLVDDFQNSNSYAAYADLTYELFPGFHVNAGGRFSEDERAIDRAVLTPAGSTILTGTTSFSENKATYKGGADYHFTEDLMAYANYSTGYRPGSFASTYAFPDVTPILLGHTGAETANNVEVGVKSEWLEHRVRANLTAFDMHYNDMQQQNSTFPYPITTEDILIKGIEVEFDARPIQALNITASLGTLSAEVTGGTAVVIGQRPRFTPKLRYSVAAEYREPISDKATIFFGGNATYTSSQFTDDADIPSVTLDAFTLYNAQVGVELDGGRYRLALNGKNLSNKAYFLNTSPDAAQWYAPPREIAATLTARF